ncbi:PepSY domain-containing protein [Mesorhizobium captivum]|uniref:PepSY domain-containing protein n=2 Tax=Mesorhizobium TaxID=68287 RepID=UPI002A23BE8B|nr:PepSY domain-containing protein [Mesorhizobium sp. VK3C]MDX8449447.1 PepSY domain-containing protein [Mesorhizobium sp. VK3C]
MKAVLMRLAAVGVAGLLLAAPFAVRAQDDDDHDRARDLYERGEIEGLADIMAIVRAKAPGEIVAVDLIRAGGKWVYRFQVVAADGRRRIVDVDAGAGVLDNEGDHK